jgi:polyisoprenoid-binding protein YceI
MKKIIYPAIIATIISLFAFTEIMSNWKVKGSEAVIEFSGGNIHGRIEGLKAEIVFDKDHPEQAKMSASVDVTSIATGFFIKTSHAKDALGADTYPTIKFVSTSVTKNGSGFSANGNLTMKGKTKPSVIHFTFDDKSSQGVFKGTMKVIPKEYGIDRNGTPPSVEITLTVPVAKS